MTASVHEPADVAGAVALLRAAHALLGDAADPTALAVRTACRLGIDAGERVPGPADAPTLATFGPPAGRRQRWLIHYPEDGVSPSVYDAALYGDAKAELLARAHFERAATGWNCTLFRIAPLLPDAAPDPQLRAALRGARAALDVAREPDRTAAAAAAAAAVALGEIAPGDEAMVREAIPLRAAQRRHLAEIVHERDAHERSISHDREYRAAHPERDTARSDEDRALYAMVDRDQDDKSARLARDVALAERVAGLWSSDPGSLLLPIGTTVRTLASETLPGDWPVPAAGLVGVVTGYSKLRSRPNVVSFLGPVPMTEYEGLHGDEDRAVRFNYLPWELEVVSHGSIMGSGVVVDRPGWTPTHGHGTIGDVLYDESMVVEANRHLWRVQPCSGPPECTQIARATRPGRASFAHLVPLATDHGAAR